MYLESLKIVIPMGLLMLAGCLIHAAKISTPEGEKTLDRLSYNVFMPALLFYNIVTCPNLNRIGASFFITATCATLIAVLFAVLLARRKTAPMRVSTVVGLCRTNMSVYGSAVTACLLSAADAKLAMLYLSFGVVVQNMAVLSTLEIMGVSKFSFGKIVLQVFKNPQIMAAIPALILNLLGVQLPEVILSPIKSLSQCATPIAFLLLGMTFHLSRERTQILQIIEIIFCRLIVMPALILLPIALLFKPAGAELLALTCLLATPCAASSLPLTNRFGGDALVTNETVLWTSILSIVTFPLFVQLTNILTAI